MTAGELVRFHTRHKMLLLAHSPVALRRLGQLAAVGRRHPERANVVAAYQALFDDTCAQPITRAGHVNALQHMAGHLRGVVDDGERRRLATLIDEYSAGTIGLNAVLDLIRTHAIRHDVRYLLAQVYLTYAT